MHTFLSLSICFYLSIFRSHITASENDGALVGPYFPRRDRRSLPGKSARPPRPMLQLTVTAAQLEASHGQDPDYDKVNSWFITAQDPEYNEVSC